MWLHNVTLLHHPLTYERRTWELGCLEFIMRSPPQQKLGWVKLTLAQGDDDWNERKGDQSDWKQQHWKAHDNRSTDALRAWVVSERGFVESCRKETPQKGDLFF